MDTIPDVITLEYIREKIKTNSTNKRWNNQGQIKENQIFKKEKQK